jgi:hypothetical protein
MDAQDRTATTDRRAPLDAETVLAVTRRLRQARDRVETADLDDHRRRRLRSRLADIASDAASSLDGIDGRLDELERDVARP